MTATLHRLGPGRDAGLYYTSDPNKEVHNRDEYYAADGAGVWHSTGQTIVQDGAPITVETFRDLCAGIDPRTGKALVRGAGEKHRAGLDVTFTPGKSVSVLWMAGDRRQRQQIEVAHRAAVTRALRFVLDENLVVVRHGPGGIHRAKPTDLIVGRFDHFTTRAGDPNIHTHSVILNLAGSPMRSERYGSQHLTTETDALFSAQLMLGAAYRSALAEHLAALGFDFRSVGQGQFEIAGLPQSLLETFSKRSHDIENLVGRDATAAQKEVAALSTRQAKANLLTGAALEAHWQRELAETGLDPWHLAASAKLEQVIGDEPAIEALAEPPAIPGAGPVAVAASQIFLTESVLDRQRLLEKALVEASLRGVGPDAVYTEMATLESSGLLVRLDDTHWTTPAIAATEAQMLAAADRPNENNWVEPSAVAQALADASHLSAEQADAVRAACSADGVSLVEAAAGTGKTTLAKAAVAAAEHSGMTIVGLAPSWIAADELGRSTGIESQAIAKWRFDRAGEDAPQVTAKTMIVVDEAGMIGTSDLSAILVTARNAGAKVVLMGDRRQLQAISGASALSAIADTLEKSAVLDTVRRQHVDWQRAASVLMARGDASAGLRTYARKGHVDLVYGEAAVQSAVIAKWTDARQRHGDDVLIITRRNIDAMALNTQARLTLRLEGTIANEEVALPSIGRDDKARELAIAVGDRIRFGETLPAYGIRNGTRAVVEEIGPYAGRETQMRLRLENGEVINTAWGNLVRQVPGRKPTSPRISHGYAGTAYAAQGRTAAATVLHIARKTDAREIYVGLTRHQHDVQIVVEADRLDAACRQRQVDARIAPTKTAMMERLFDEASQYREKHNVIDFVADRAEFIATGEIKLPDPEQRWSVRAAFGVYSQLTNLMQSTKQILKTLERTLQPNERTPLPLPKGLAALRESVRQRDRAFHQNRSGPDIEP